MKTPLIATILLAALPAGAAPLGLSGPGRTTIESKGSGFELHRDGRPYFVKGIGGSTHFKLGAEAGANSVRTWGIEKMDETLDAARRLGMTVCIGIWLDHNAASYRNDGYKERIRKEFAGVLRRAARHPATLCYALGNETNSGADTEEAWRFINELAEMAKKEDPHHPTMTVLAGSSVRTINNVARFAPAIDMLGINSYGGIVVVARDVAQSDFKGPYLVTEWGPLGHWEVGKAPWGAPLEQTSDEKAGTYDGFYQRILGDKRRCLGSYVFLWGQKQERTPTWYSMFVEQVPALGIDGEATIAVDVMFRHWTGKPPANRAPVIRRWKAGNRSGERHFTLEEGGETTVSIDATDPDGDRVKVVWEVMAEATRLGQGGSHEPRPESIRGAIDPGREPGSVTVRGHKPGNYRLFAYVLDGKGKVATINLPYQVE